MVQLSHLYMTSGKTSFDYMDLCWGRLLRGSNQLILKEVSSEYSLEGLMPKLKFQYFGHLILRANSSEETLMLGKIEEGEGDNRG